MTHRKLIQGSYNKIKTLIDANFLSVIQPEERENAICKNDK